MEIDDNLKLEQAQERLIHCHEEKKITLVGRGSNKSGIEPIPPFAVEGYGIHQDENHPPYLARSGAMRNHADLWFDVRALKDEVIEAFPPRNSEDPPPLQDLRSSNVPRTDLRKWYRGAYIPRTKEEGLLPSMQDDWDAAKKAFPKYRVARQPIRDIRKKEAPASWKSRNKPKKPR